MAVVWDPSISYDNANFDFLTSTDGRTAWISTGSGVGYYLHANKLMAWNDGKKYYWEVVWNGALGESKTGIAVPSATSNLYGSWRYVILSGTNPVIRWTDPANPGSTAGAIGLGASMLASPGDVLMFALDNNTGKLWVGLNGAWYNGGDPAAGTGQTRTVSLGYDYQPFVAFDQAGQTSQNATFYVQSTNYSVPAGFTTLDLPPPEVALPSFSYSLNTLEKHTALVLESYALDAKELHTSVVIDQWALAGNAVWTPVVTATHYRLTLRAAGLEDLELPMSSFQSRVRQGRPSFLEVYVPGILDFMDAIVARNDGELVVELGARKTDGTTSVQEIARGNLQDVRYDRGPRSTTGTLTGRKTQTYTTPKALTLDDVELVSVATNKRVRSKIRNDVFPGDTVTAAGLTFLVDNIQHIVSTQQAYMELSDG